MLPRSVLVICLDYLLTHLGYFAILPTLTLLLMDTRGFGVGEVATAVFVFTLAMRSAQFFIGPYLDRFPPRTNMVFGVLLAGLSFSFIGFVDLYVLVLLCLIFAGIGISINGLAARALVSATGKADGKTLLYFSSINVFVNVAAAVGPLLGSFVLGTSLGSYLFQMTGAFYVSAGLMILLLLRTTPLESAERRPQFLEGYKQALTDRPFLKFLAMNAIGWFAYSQLFMALPYFVSKQFGSESKLGMLYTTNALLIIGLQVAISALVKRWLPDGKEIYRLLTAYMLFGLAFVSAAAAQSFYTLFGTIVLFTLAEMIFTPSVDTIVSSLAKPGLRTTYFSILGLSTAVGESSGSFAGVRLLHFWTERGLPHFFWLTIAALVVAVSFLLHLLTRRQESPSAQIADNGM